MYVIQVIDNETKRQVQRSFARTWAECEDLYREYQEDFEGCSVTIIPGTKEDLQNIEEPSTMDVVEVVRCKKCRECIMVGNRPYCDFWKRNTEEDWYCSQYS